MSAIVSGELTEDLKIDPFVPNKSIKATPWYVSNADPFQIKKCPGIDKHRRV
jgi:hypothetical protein